MHFVEVVPGRGSLDYAAYLREIAKLPQRPPLMLEHLKTAEEYDEGASYIRRIGRESGVTFA
jgi:sugar phosphate isomerase/epimerase